MPLVIGEIAFEFEVVVRPGAREFLRELSRHFSLIVYSTEERANLCELAKVLEGEEAFFEFVFGRE